MSGISSVSISNRFLSAAMRTMFVVLLAVGFTVASVPSPNAEAGSKGYASGKSSGHAGKGQIKRHYLGASSGKSAHGYSTGSSKMRNSGVKRVTSSASDRNGKMRTYSTRRSVLDQGYDHTNVRKNADSRSVRISRRELRHSGNQGAVARSGVTYMSGQSSDKGSKRSYRGMQQIAGGSSGIRKIELNARRDGHRHLSGRFYNSGLIVIGVGAPGHQEIAGDAANGNADCAYGTYCTIDLGGPKIITLNDVEDITDGEFVEDLSDEEYLKRYGSK